MSTTVCHRCFFTVLAFSLTGCGIGFDEPLTPVGASIDSRLQGEWQVIIIGVDEPSKDSVSISAKNLIFTDSKGGSETVAFASTQLGDHDFITCEAPGDDGDKCRWYVSKYKCVSKDEIHIFPMDDEKVAAAIRNGGLSGETTRVKPGLLLALLGEKSHEEITKMTSSRDELQSFLKASPEECFDMSTALVKLKRKQSPKAKSEQ